MVFSAGLCWFALLNDWPGPVPCFLLPVCTFFWLWACKNRIFGPIKIDMGIVTFFPGMLVGGLCCFWDLDASWSALAGVGVGGCLLIAGNFFVPIGRILKTRPTFAQVGTT